jgi:hypothetical protein
LGINDATRAQNQHTLAILPSKTPRAVISLFGGDNIPEAVISLGSEEGLLASPNETMNPDTRVGVRINPITHELVWLTVRDLNMVAWVTANLPPRASSSARRSAANALNTKSNNNNIGFIGILKGWGVGLFLEFCAGKDPFLSHVRARRGRYQRHLNRC